MDIINDVINGTPQGEDFTPYGLQKFVGHEFERQNTGKIIKSKKQLFSGRYAAYFSLEYLMGRMIHNNLFCLGKPITERWNKFEDIEDAALGNGGLGRLAACFLDSAATLNLPLIGYGIRYKYGLFKQYFEDGYQREKADDWTKNGDPWGWRNESYQQVVHFADGDVLAVPYDYPIIGYGTDNIGTLRLWQAENLNEFDFKTFDNGQYLNANKNKIDAESISAVLYPNDNSREGLKLRVKQEYFLASASIQDMLSRDNKDFSIQLNDTHPVIGIPEYIYQVSKTGTSFEDAFKQASEIFNYTNHTVMPEALEKWDASLIEEILPEIYNIIVLINERLINELYVKGISKKQNESMKIIKNGQVHMANMACYAAKYINGVAEIHSKLLTTTVLKDWYCVYPKKFQNKTNGITQRRWLGLCNPELSEFFTKNLKSDNWLTDLPQLKNLEKLSNNEDILKEFGAIKDNNKNKLSEYIKSYEKIEIDPKSVFDVQIKRLHEYKRQLLNAFSILYIYFGIKDGSIKNFHPTTFIFGAKSAPGYRRAKGIIKYINEIAKMIDNDPQVSGILKVVFVQNYNVSYAEKIIPAADISEQISPAGTEASGTGNMKLMLSGAVTLGTLDGANIEIVEQAGEENNYIFGAKVEDIDEIKETYDPRKILAENEKIRRVVSTLIDGTFSDGGEWGNGEGSFRELYYGLTDGTSWHKPDHYYLLLDFESYVTAKIKANTDYQNRTLFLKKQFLNAVNAGKFSSDRTIQQYADEIWKIKPVEGNS